MVKHAIVIQEALTGELSTVVQNMEHYLSLHDAQELAVLIVFTVHFAG